MKKTILAITIALALALSVFAFTACGDEAPDSGDKDGVTVLASVSDVYRDITGHDFPMAGTFVMGERIWDAPHLV